MPAITKSDTLRLPLLVTRSLVVFPTISEEIEASRAVSINAIVAPSSGVATGPALM